MQGRKPNPHNVIPLTGAKAPRLAPAVLALNLRPVGLTKAESKEWMRVAVMMADPSLDRLKPHFVDTIMEYCRATLRLRAFRKFFLENQAKPEDVEAAEAEAGNSVERLSGKPGLDAEIYVVHGRNGTQLKAHPYVAQMNETWRQWRSLVAELGLSPTAERNMMPGQGSLFDDPAAEFYAG